jgi:Ca2+-binding EF-hand superfamily protein
MKHAMFAIAGITLLSACQTVRQLDNPLATAYSEFDADGDGVISRQEGGASPALARSFDRIDTNQSGGIDDREYKAATMHLADMSFSEVDINDDGVVSEREAAAMPVSLKEAFGDIDTDGDSNVSPTEYRAATINLLEGVEFRSLDTDGDGVIGEEEAREMPPLSEAFDRVDTDADGLVSGQEFAAAQR